MFQRIVRHIVRTNLFLAVFAWATIAASASPDHFVFDNGTVQRTLERIDGAWRTTSLVLSSDQYAEKVVSDEFQIKVWGGSTVNVADYASSGHPVETVADDGTMYCQLEYTAKPGAPDGAPKHVTVRHMARDGEPYLRKQVVVEMDEGQAIERLEVERFRTSQDCRQGGKGEPVFVGHRCFVGLEYPGSETSHASGLVTLAHHPGLAGAAENSESWVVKSKWSVMALAPAAVDQRAFFDDYFESIRIPLRNMLHYNSWYDLRGEEVNPERLVETFKGFKGPLCDEYGIEMDTFVPDDGYQEKDSIWVPRPAQYPDGLVGLRDKLEALGTRLGIWLPLNGYLLNTDWGEALGLERAYVKGAKKNYYCLSAPSYNAAIRDALKRLITEGHLAYMKHDFNYLDCDAEGHGHLASAKQGWEANLDAHLELLAFQRTVQPDIFLNVTSLAWHSPWWLQHADTIWMNASDHGFDFTHPQLSPREGAMSFRDAHFYKVLLEANHLVPLSAYMTHGIILGRYERLGGDEETMREWSDYCFLYYGRGVQLKELYISPDLMTPERWRILGETTRWAIDKKDDLAPVRMFGSDPRRGGTYGYAHWLDGKGLVIVRNPGLAGKSVAIPLDASAGFDGVPGANYKARVVYPYVEHLPGTFVAGSDVVMEVPGATVLALEFTPGTPASAGPVAIPDPPGCTTTLNLEAKRLHVRVPMPDEDLLECTLRVVVEGGAMPPDRPTFEVEGAPVQAREAGSEDWSMRSIDLRAYRGQEIDIVVQLPVGSDALFMGDIKVSVWLVMDRSVDAPDTPAGEVFPHMPSQHHRRQTLELLSSTPVPYSYTPREVTEDDLAGIQAAKVRLLVYGVHQGKNARKSIHLNGEPVTHVPVSAEPVDSWQERYAEIDKKDFENLRMTNVLRLDNVNSDYYKFKGLALAVQLADGTWVRSEADDGAHTSVLSWAHFEGTGFEDGFSAPIELSF